MIGKYLDVSTSHVTQRDMELLGDAPDAGPLFAYPYEEGAFITGPDFSDLAQAAAIDAECREFGYSESLIKLLIYARLNECLMIRLDADGDWIEALDHHAW